MAPEIRLALTAEEIMAAKLADADAVYGTAKPGDRNRKRAPRRPGAPVGVKAQARAERAKHKRRQSDNRRRATR